MDPKDAEMAEKIRHFFWSGAVPLPRFPWKNTHDISQVKWFRNRSAKARIVIFSDHPHAEGIKFAFNDCNFLDEPVDLWDMNFVSNEVTAADIVFVVFPRETPA